MGTYVKTFETFNSFNNTIIDFDIPTEEYLEKVLTAMNINYIDLKMIAEGGYGFVTDLGNGAVFKITSDPVEAFYAKKLISIESDNLVKTYDAKEIVSTYQFGKLFGIHQEKLNTNLPQIFKHVIDYLNKPNNLKIKMLDGTIKPEDVITFFENKLHTTSENLLIYFNKVYNMYKECAKYGLPDYEIHSKNVGISYHNQKELVYFDISSPIESHTPGLDIVTI